jgi:hypothetical protein
VLYWAIHSFFGSDLGALLKFGVRRDLTNL